MIAENEAVMLTLGLGVAVFMALNHSRVRHIPGSLLFRAAFHVLLLGWVLTIAEGFFWPHFLNTLEHACYAISAFLTAAWSWRAFWLGEADTQ